MWDRESRILAERGCPAAGGSSGWAVSGPIMCGQVGWLLDMAWIGTVPGVGSNRFRVSLDVSIPGIVGSHTIAAEADFLAELRAFLPWPSFELSLVADAGNALVAGAAKWGARATPVCSSDSVDHLPRELTRRVPTSHTSNAPSTTLSAPDGATHFKPIMDSDGWETRWSVRNSHPDDPADTDVQAVVLGYAGGGNPNADQSPQSQWFPIPAGADLVVRVPGNFATTEARGVIWRFGW